MVCAVNTRPLELAAIRADASLRARAEARPEVALEYAEAMRQGAKFPPVVVFFDGANRWLADGFYRLAAARQAGLAELPAEVRTGGRDDALLYAAAANATHGQPRSVEDRRLAVELLLRSAVWGGRSNSWVAEQAKVSGHLVKVTRERLGMQVAAIETRAGRSTSSTNTLAGKPLAQPRPGSPARAEGEAAGGAAALPAVLAGRLSGESGREACPTTGERQGARAAPGREGPAAAVLDGLGLPVPEELAEAFKDAEQLQRAGHLLLQVRQVAREVKQRRGGAFLGRSVEADLDNARAALRAAVPFTVCPACRGAGCVDRTQGPCKGAGWVPEDIFRRLPGELQAWCRTRTEGARQTEPNLAAVG